MPLPEVVLNQLKCCFFNDGHIAIQPLIVECGANTCKSCINEANEEKIHCYNCNKTHEKNISRPINNLSESMLQVYLKDLFKYVEETLITLSNF